MPTVDIQETGSFDVALRRFKRACEKAGIPTKLRQMEYYEKPTTKRKRKHAAAVKRFVFCFTIWLTNPFFASLFKME